jgi:hypothetical protein
MGGGERDWILRLNIDAEHLQPGYPGCNRAGRQRQLDASNLNPMRVFGGRSNVDALGQPAETRTLKRLQ